MATRVSTDGDQGPEPDLIIGIDFGMTGTGVAYASRIDRGVKVLETWPGEMAKKVPSAVLYQNSKLASWGFGTREQENATGVIKSFKGMIDRGDTIHFQGQNPGTHNVKRQNALTWLRDFLGQLREYLESELQRIALPPNQSWNDSRITFLFSYPTTWNMETTVKPFEQAIRNAGYGTQDSHQVKVILNEAEAAMAGHFMTSQLPAKGDLLVIADIGGGTCDVGAFVVDYPTDGAYPRLQPRSSGWGVDVGSSKIDEHFEDVVAARLKPVIQ